VRAAQRSARQSVAGGVSPWMLIVIAAVLGSLYVFYGDRLLPAPEPVQPRNPEAIDEAILTRLRARIEAVKLDPRTGKRHADLAVVYEANNLWQEAIDSYANAGKLDPGNALWDFHRGICMLATGDAEGSLEIFEDVVLRLPELAAVHHRLGVALAQEGRLDDAANAFESSTRLRPKTPESFTAYASLENERENYEHAMQLAQRALGIAPTYQSAQYALGLAYQGLGRLDDAAGYLASGMGAKPLHVGDSLSAAVAANRVGYLSEFQAAMRLIDQGQPAGAVPMLKKLLADRPTDTDVMCNLAAAYEALGEYDEAERVLIEALAVDDQKFVPHINLAGVYLGMQSYPLALESIDRALGLAPNVGKAYLIKARICMGMNDLNAAYQAYKDTARYDPTLVEVHSRMGELSRVQNRYEDAVKHYADAFRLLPADVGARVQHCELLIALNRRSEARVAFQAIQRMAPTHEGVPRLRQLLGGG